MCPTKGASMLIGPGRFLAGGGFSGRFVVVRTLQKPSEIESIDCIIKVFRGPCLLLHGSILPNIDKNGRVCNQCILVSFALFRRNPKVELSLSPCCFIL